MQYPSILPPPLLNIKQIVDHGIQKTKFYGGKTQVFEAYKSPYISADVNFLLNRFEEFKFKSFFVRVGVDWFDLPFKNGDIDTVRCRFISDFQVRRKSQELAVLSTVVQISHTSLT